MWILLINNDNRDQDYLTVTIMHGLVSLGHEVIDYKYMAFMDKENESIIDRNTLYGKGFSYAFTLEGRKNIDRNNIEDKIAEHYFDLVIYRKVVFSDL